MPDIMIFPNIPLFIYVGIFTKALPQHLFTIRDMGIAGLDLTLSPPTPTPTPPPHTESTRHESTRSPPPLYPMSSQIRLSRIRGIHVTPHTESMRFVRHKSNRTMLSQSVTCCIFGATCDRFVSPIMYVKIMYTLLMEVESAVTNECLNGYKCSMFL